MVTSRVPNMMSHRYSLLLIGTLMQVVLCAQMHDELDLNDIRFRMFSNGYIGHKASLGPTGGFEVPQGTGANALFAAGLWFSGTAPGGEVRVAAMMHDVAGQKDFFPGPLTNDGTASVSPAVSAAYDNVWVVTRQEIAAHIAYHQCLNDPGCDLLIVYPDGYSTPPSIAAWPAANPYPGHDPLLAPFHDFNADGHYDPADGDVPCILGDQAMFAVFNDMLQPHTQSGGPGVGLEVQVMPFVFSGHGPALDQTLFLRHHIINRSNITYDNAMVGFFNDFDIGCPNDDFMGTDPSRNLLYAYNRTDVDPACMGLVGYGDAPPAVGMTVIKGPLLDPNGSDDPSSVTMPAWNGHGFGDGEVDNERHGLSGSLVFFPPGGTDPTAPVHFWNYMNGAWTNGVPLTSGGNGYSTDPAAIPCRFMFPGSDDPVGAGTDGVVLEPWSDAIPSPGAGDPDRKGVFSMGPFTLGPGGHVDLVVAYVFARASSGGALASVAALQARTDSVHAFARTLPLFDFPEETGFHGQCVDYPLLGMQERPAHGRLVLFPSPASDQVSFVAPPPLTGGTLVVRDALGRAVLQQQVDPERNIVYIGGLADGVYVCEVVTPHARYIGKLVKE